MLDIDECKDKSSCQNGKCLNTAGSFMCECRKGFKLNKQAMACIGKLLELDYTTCYFILVSIACCIYLLLCMLFISLYRFTCDSIRKVSCNRLLRLYDVFCLICWYIKQPLRPQCVILSFNSYLIDDSIGCESCCLFSNSGLSMLAGVTYCHIVATSKTCC